MSNVADLLKNKFVLAGGVMIVAFGGLAIYKNSQTTKTEDTTTSSDSKNGSNTTSSTSKGSSYTFKTKDGVEITLSAEMKKEQDKYTAKYGEAPDGLYWGDEMDVIPYGNPNLMPEEVASNYLKALSLLNITEAQKNGYKTATLKSYTKMNSSDTEFSYANTFKKEMFKQVLLSVQPLQVQDTANFANGNVVLTMQIEVLDLSDKDFWKSDSENIFTNIYMLRRGESDITKAKQYVYNLILDHYKSGNAKTKLVNISMTLEKAYTGGYAVTKDDELNAIAQYTDGETVASNMLELYEKWVNGQDEAKLKQLVEKVQKGS